MKRLSTLLSVLLCLILLGGSLFAQNRHIKMGDKAYEQLVYPRAVRHYEKGLTTMKDLRAMERVADAYKQLSDTKNAEKWYGEAVKMKGSAPIDKLYYGQMLKTNGKVSEARKWFDAYLQTGENPIRAKRMIVSCDFAQEGRKDSLRYKISNEPCNTKHSEFGAVPYRQGHLIVAEKRTGARRIVNLRNNNGFYDIFYVERDPKAKSGLKIRPVKGKVNRKYNEGPATLTSDQSKLYFTRSFYVKNKHSFAPANRSRLKILSAEYLDGKWKNIQEFQFNGENYSCGHPSISPDGNTMVFASDIPGGFGGTDLYVTRREGNGWSVPQNLGSTINTEDDERYPFLHPSGVLYFASDGLPGFGGMDVFSSPKEGSYWGKPINAGYGLNSASDDFAVASMPGKSMGYFASNRNGNDDIYQFKHQPKMNGTIVDKRTGKPMQGVAVTVLDANNKEAKYTTDTNGKFTHLAESGREYLVSASKPAYLQTKEKVSTAEISLFEDVNFQMVLEHELVLSASGSVTDANTKAPISGATVRLISNTEKSISTDAQGNYSSQVDADKEYAVVIKKPGYIPQIFNFSTEGKKETEDFRINASLVPGNAVFLEGKTVETESKKPIPSAHVRSINMKNGEEIHSSITRKDGAFWQVVDPRQEPTLFVSKEEFFTARMELAGVDSNTKDTTIVLEIGMVPYEVGALVKVIYYDYNKSDIKKPATKDLLEIVYFLQDNPAASVQLSSYTDARGGNEYNEELSQRRADASVGYLVQKGISSSRLASKGYGESMIVNQCKDDVPCTEEEHGMNRRTEIRITKVTPEN